MRNPKGWLVCVMAVAIGLGVLGSPPRASADFVLALAQDGGPLTVVATGPSFNPVFASGTFGNYTYSFFSAVATDSTLDSNLLSSTTQIQSLTAAPHTLSLYVSNQDYLLPADTLLTVRSGLGGTYGSTPGFIGAATFQMWSDAGERSAQHVRDLHQRSPGRQSGVWQCRDLRYRGRPYWYLHTARGTSVLLDGRNKYYDEWPRKRELLQPRAPCRGPRTRTASDRSHGRQRYGAVHRTAAEALVAGHRA